MSDITYEQLDEFDHFIREYDAIRSQDVQVVIDALRAERAAHQSTREELEATREVVGAAQAAVSSWQSIQREAEFERWMENLCDAVDAYNVARAGQGERTDND